MGGEREYHERVRISHEKTNLVLVGEGIGKTAITANVASLIYTYGLSAASMDGGKITLLLMI